MPQGHDACADSCSYRDPSDASFRYLDRVVPYAQFPNEMTEDPRRSSADIFLAAVAVDQQAAEAWKIENIYHGGFLVKKCKIENVSRILPP